MKKHTRKGTFKGSLSWLITTVALMAAAYNDPQGPASLVFDDFELGEGLEITYLIERRKPRWRLIQLKKDKGSGRAEDYFFDASAKYDITLFCVDGTGGESSVEVFINDRNAGKIESAFSGSRREKTFRGVSVQQWSRISLVFSGDGAGGCRVNRLEFTPAGAFEGKREVLEKPETPMVFETVQERSEGRKMIEDFVNEHIDSLMERRMAELTGLKSPAQWSARQHETRAQLPEFFGEFPEKTPLNARITGRINREGYTIDRLIFESQPGYYVTANLYLPEGREFPVPGVVFTCGHSSVGKASRLYQEACLGMVLKGYVVLAYDPIGQGERSEYFNPGTRENLFNSPGDQHMYLAWPTFFVDRTFAGLRVWDGIRATDYLVSRPEVDPSRLAVVGNSGGGQMAFLIAAVDERIGVCVAAHPGGPDEGLYLKGWGLGSRRLIDKEILSLIPPRPCRIVVGRDSGEEPTHRPKYEDMLLFYEGLGQRENIEFVLVDGVHDMRRPKREATYEWLNRWFDKEEEGKTEPELHAEKEKDLRCTESGFTLISLGGESGQSLNAARLEEIYQPSGNSRILKENIRKRLGLTLPAGKQKPVVQSREILRHEDIDIEKFTFLSEQGIRIPSVLYKPRDSDPDSPVYLFVSGKGKPRRFDPSGLPLSLAMEGSTVLAIDVRGTGETSPTPLIVLDQSEFSMDTPPNPKHHYILRSRHYIAAIQSPAFGRTMTGMRTFDILRAVDLIHSRRDLEGKRTIVVGDGPGGLWVTIAAVFDPRISGVATLGTLPSYKPFITNHYYNVWDYFWVPGVLRDFDIPDLAGLVSPRPQVWIDPIKTTGGKIGQARARQLLGTHENLHILSPENRDTPDPAQILRTHFNGKYVSR